MTQTKLRIAAAELVLLWTALAHADVVEECEQHLDPDLSIASCTAIIRWGEYSGLDLFRAHFCRGSMYASRRYFPRVIEDMDQAICLDSEFAWAYYDCSAA